MPVERTRNNINTSTVRIPPPSTKKKPPVEKKTETESTRSGDSVDVGKQLEGGFLERTAWKIADVFKKKTPWQKQLDTPLPEKEWTVMVYSNVTKDQAMIESSALSRAAGKLLKSGSGKNINMIAQVANEADEGKAERLFLPKRPFGEMQPEPKVLEKMGRTNMGSEQTFTDFLKWGMKNFPAKKYMVIMEGHAKAHTGAIPDPAHGDKLQLHEIAGGLNELKKGRNGQKLDVLMMDACMMGSGEFDYEIKDSAQYVIASEEVKKSGIGYEKIGKKMRKKANSRKGLEAEEAVDIVMKNSGGYGLPTLSAVDLSKMGQFGESIKAFKQAMNATSTDRKILEDIAKKTEHYCKDEQLNQDPSLRGANLTDAKQVKDVFHFAQLVQSDDRIEDKKLKTAAAGIMKAVDDSVVENRVAPGNLYAHSHGISLNISSHDSPYPASHYKGLSISKDTGWDGKL